MNSKNKENITYFWEDIDPIIKKYNLGSYGLQQVIDAIDSYKPRTQEQKNLINTYKKKIFNRAVSQIIRSNKDKTYLSLAEDKLSYLELFSAKYGFKVPKKVTAIRKSIYQDAINNCISSINPNNTSTYCENELLRISKKSGDFSAANIIYSKFFDSDNILADIFVGLNQ
ncbi:MAG: hypothetical protein KAJ47_02800, partial [Candidatus Aenigmarchaeota archaeon]|nr:hypothetical protein [Candidatus Aenigmarchaeota archaeon]